MSKLEHLRKQVWKIECGGNYKLAMLYLAEKTRLGVSKVKIQDIADACCVSRSQAKSILSKLREDGFLHVVGNENGGNSQPRIYKITDKKGSEFRLLKGAGKPNPLYICIQKAVYANGKAPHPRTIDIGDADIANTLMAGGF